MAIANISENAVPRLRYSPKDLPSQEALLALLKYDPETGLLYWRERAAERFSTKRNWKIWNTRFAGKEALKNGPNGYKAGRIENVYYNAHRVIWKMIYGTDPEFIDHINGSLKDNRLSNLRSVSKTGNAQNMKKRKDNTSGTTGVSWNRLIQKWGAQISVEKTIVYLGWFTSKEQAIIVRKSAEKNFGYHPNHGR